jgi:hypothetical protein
MVVLCDIILSDRLDILLVGDDLLQEKKPYNDLNILNFLLARKRGK